MQYIIPLPKSVKGQKLRDSLQITANMLGWIFITPLGLPINYTPPDSIDQVEVTIDEDMTTVAIGEESYELTGSKTFLHIPGILGSRFLRNVVETTYIIQDRAYSELLFHSDKPLGKKDFESLKFRLYEIIQAEALEIGFTAPTLIHFNRTESPPSMREFIGSEYLNDLGGLTTAYADTVTYLGNIVGHEYEPKKFYTPYAALSFPDGDTRSYPLDSSLARVMKGDVVAWESSKVPLEKRLLSSNF